MNNENRLERAKQIRTCLLCKQLYIFVCIKCLQRFRIHQTVVNYLELEGFRQFTITTEYFSNRKILKGVTFLHNTKIILQEFFLVLLNYVYKFLNFTKPKINQLDPVSKTQNNPSVETPIICDDLNSSSAYQMVQTSIMHTYIHLETFNEKDGTVKVSSKHSMESIIRNFYVYVVTLDVFSEDDNEDEEDRISAQGEDPEDTPRNQDSEKKNTEPTESSGSIHSKKSSSVFQGWMSKGKKKKTNSTDEDTDERSKTKIPIPKPRLSKTSSGSKSEEQAYKYSGDSEQNSKNGQSSSADLMEDSETKSSKNYSFFRKLLHKQVNRITQESNNKMKHTDSADEQVQTLEPGEEVYLQQCSMSQPKFEEMQQLSFKKSATKVDSEEALSVTINAPSSTTDPVPTSYLSCNYPILDIGLADSLREVLELSSRLRDSESHLVQMLSKYIQDHNLEKELLTTVSNHAKLHIETERRAQTLANEMWLQQADINRTQQNALQDTLNNLVKQNRKLQEDNETLLKKNERLYSKIPHHSHFSTRSSFSCNSLAVDSLTKHNEKLRAKINSMFTQVDEFEKELNKLQQKNGSLEQQVRNGNAQIQNYKALLSRAQANYDLEQANLSHQLQTNSMVIKESVEAGDVLLEDLDGLKRQMKSMPCSINWTKFKCRGSSLTDLIHLCRSCINEIGRELTTAQNQLNAKDKDNDKLQDEVKCLQESLSKNGAELNKLNQQLEVCSVYELEKQEFICKYTTALDELCECRKQIEEVSKQYEQDKNSWMSSFNTMQELNKQIGQKEQELVETQRIICECKNENEALAMQVNGMNQILTSSGSGDIARELADTQEKLTFFSAHYYELLSEKNYLIEQLQSANAERETIAQYQQSYYQHLLLQQQDLEVLNRDNGGLKEQLDAERHTVMVLQNERMRHLEERNVLKEIYEQLKSEIAKVQQLETTVSGINMEANRLAVIAEYNKQLGDRLKSEVTEKDAAICELQSSVEHLNSIQMENAKDKMALCAELNQMHNLKDQLNNSLVVNHNKIIQLNETKKEIEDKSNSHLKLVEEMQQAERAALKQLLKDFKNVVAQRDNLLTIQQKHLQQISELQGHVVSHSRNFDDINDQCKEGCARISRLEKAIRETEMSFAAKTEKLQSKLNFYEQNISELNKTIQQLRKEKDSAENSVKYLQNTSQKLHSQLNDTRQSEAELKNLLANEIKDKELLRKSVCDCNSTTAKKEEENMKLTKKIEKMAASYENFLNEYDKNMREVANAENLSKNDSERTKVILEKNNTEIERLGRVVEEKDCLIEKLEETCNGLNERNQLLESTVGDIEIQSRLLSESNAAQLQLQETLTGLQHEHEGYKQEILELSAEIEELRCEITVIQDQRESDYEYYKQFIEELHQAYNKEKDLLKKDLRELTQKLRDVTEQYEKLKNSNKKLNAAHKDLAVKLLRAVRVLIDEKVSRQNADAKCVDVTQQALRLKGEKDALNQHLGMLTNELQELRCRCDELATDKQNVQNTLNEMHDRYKEICCRSDTVEQELRVCKMKCEMATKSTSTGDSSCIGKVSTCTQCKPYPEERSPKLEAELEQCRQGIMLLKKEIAMLQQDLTALEFQKCEMSLRLHETRGKLITEEALNEEMREMNQIILTTILAMKEENIVSPCAADTLMRLLCNCSSDGNY